MHYRCYQISYPFFVPEFAYPAVRDDTRKCRLIHNVESEAWAFSILT